MSSGADEVAVDLAVAVLGVGHDEAGAALTAVDGTFEVVVVDLGGFGGEVWAVRTAWTWYQTSAETETGWFPL